MASAVRRRVATGAAWLLTLVALLALTGCQSLIPAYQRPEAPIPARYAP